MIRTEQATSHTNGAIVAFNVNSLPAMIDRAVRQLASATTSAEVLEARAVASVVYDAAKKAARLAKAKGAHDDLIAKAHRAQADALEIEAAAKRRLADEYDAAQERGEVRTQANNQHASSTTEEAAGVGDIGLTHKDIHEAREIRDAEENDPGIIRRTLDADLSANKEPTKASVRKAIKATKAPKEGPMEGEIIPPVKQHSGPRINIPEGMTAETLTRKGIALEADGFSSEEVAGELGVAIVSYRRMRDIVLVADHKGLTEHDTDIAARALAMLNEVERVQVAWPLIEPITIKLWGTGSFAGLPSAREAKRLERFEHSFGIIMQSCMTTDELDIPYLSDDRAKTAVKEINAARRALSDLLNRIKGVHA